MRLCVAVVPLVYSQVVPATCALKIDSMYAWQWCQSFCASLSRNHQDWRSPDACGECPWRQKKVVCSWQHRHAAKQWHRTNTPEPSLLTLSCESCEKKIVASQTLRHRTSLLESLFLSPHQSCLQQHRQKTTMNIPWTQWGHELFHFWKTSSSMLHMLFKPGIHHPKGLQNPEGIIAFWRPSEGKDQRWRWPGRQPEMGGGGCMAQNWKPEKFFAKILTKHILSFFFLTKLVCESWRDSNWGSAFEP